MWRKFKIVAFSALCLGFDGGLFGFAVVGAILGILLGLVIIDKLDSSSREVRCRWNAIFSSIFIFSLFLVGIWFVINLIFGSDIGKYIGAVVGLIFANNIYADEKNPKEKDEEYDATKDFEYDAHGNNITSQVYGGYGGTSYNDSGASNWEEETEDEDYSGEDDEEYYDNQNYTYTDRGACCGNCYYYFGWGGEGECRGQMPDVPKVFGHQVACARWQYDGKNSSSFPMQ